jgi:Rhodanese-like domain
VTTRRDGTRIFYALGSERVEQLWATVRAVAEEHAIGLDKLARTYLGNRRELEAIDRRTLLDRMRLGDVVVLDVRPAAEFAASHIAGARSLTDRAPPPATHLARRHRDRRLLPRPVLRLRRRRRPEAA